MLELKSISKKFLSNIFKDFSYKFDSNIYFLRGCNGSGKSTLLKLIKGIYLCDSGEIYIDHKLNNTNDVVYIDGNFRTFFHRLTVFQNLEYFLSLSDLNNNSIILDDLLVYFGISDIRNQRFSSLSQGQMQLVSLIRGLSSDPKVILLDEVFSSLDSKHKKKAFIYISKFISNENGLVIFTSHEADFDDLIYKELCLS